ncbi:hypothetical protein [Pseudodesulfovibrio pelocollis]|uniref:hypothetical protein n=1 Tax=Pseudodesulfovibrio pelocollis TaxID=3051432 RepID=UPI00255AF243|nr:hypothetical protein [Pseudodesulfovibrio sp. SB368]
MGFFSWKTSDTGQSISNKHSSRGALEVWMYLPDGRIIHEPSYDGYGVFGGIDVYEFIAVHNGLGAGDCSTNAVRAAAIAKLYEISPDGEFAEAEKAGIRCPKFARTPDSCWMALRFPRVCPEQGFFYEDKA